MNYELLNKIVDYIESNLTEKIDLKYLTEVLKDDSKSRILYKIECQQ